MRSGSPPSSPSSSSSSRHGRSRTAAVERSTNYDAREDAHLSGAYIRSLVKQLCSSSMATTSKGSDEAVVDSEELPPPDDARILERRRRRRRHEHTAAADHPPARKQTRRRAHTSRPYQERLINMAEARREIVTALKLHRAAMKLRASEQEQQEEEEQERLNYKQKKPQAPQPVADLQLAPSMSSSTPPALPPPFPQLQVHKAEEISLGSPALSYFDNRFLLDSFASNSIIFSSRQPHPWPENPNHLTFPGGPLGLNLNLQHFNDIDYVSLYRNSHINSGNIHIPPTSMQLPSTPPSLLSPPNSSSPFSSSSSSSRHYSFASPDPPTNINNNNTNIGNMAPGLAGVPAAPEDDASPDHLQASEAPSPTRQLPLHPMVGVEEMAAMRSVGDRHDMEWNDSLVSTSAWWCNLLGTMETSPHRAQQQADVGINTNIINVGSGGEELAGTKDLGFFFDDVMLDIPAWLNIEEQQQQQTPDNYYSSVIPNDAPSTSLPQREKF